MGLVEASQGKIGNVVDQVLLYCYHYDPETGKYGAIISNILRLARLATILIWGHSYSFCSDWISSVQPTAKRQLRAAGQVDERSSERSS